jgi:hypothetical protein
MTPLELISVAFIVTLAAIFLLRMFWRKLKPKGASVCGGSCACAAKDTLKSPSK